MPKAAATSKRKAAPSTRPVPNLFLPAAAIRMELLEGKRGGCGVVVDGGGGGARGAARGDLVTDVAIFFEGLVEDALEFGRDARIQSDGSHGSVVQDVVEDDGAGS